MSSNAPRMKAEQEVTAEIAGLIGSERPRAGSLSPLLIVISGPGIGGQVELGSGGIDIGRHPSCGLVIASSSVSRKHARVEAEADGTFVVKDLESKNGTLVNGKRVTSHVLADGDVIKVGKAAVKFAALGNLDATYYRRLAEISATDSLTGAANRRTFDDAMRLMAARASTSDQPMSIVLFDLDHFKRINDEHGHLAGDHVLREVIGVVRGHVRTSDMLARVGGEEFAILCLGADSKAAGALAEQVRRAVEHAEIRYREKRVPVTISLGVATAPASPHILAAELYARADEALYTSKRGGRNRVSLVT